MYTYVHIFMLFYGLLQFNVINLARRGALMVCFSALNNAIYSSTTKHYIKHINIQL